MKLMDRKLENTKKNKHKTKKVQKPDSQTGWFIGDVNRGSHCLQYLSVSQIFPSGMRYIVEHFSPQLYATLSWTSE